MAVQLSESHSKLINKIAHQNGFTDDFQVSTASGSSKGDNFLGVITKVTIKNKERELELILKSASISEAFRKAAPIRDVYCRELYVYKTIFGAFEKFQDEFNVSNPFTGHPKLYGMSEVDGQECLVMENLLETGYKLWNRKIAMDAEHIKAVVTEYAKFHSISLAMAHKNPKLFEDLSKYMREHAFGEEFGTSEKLKGFTTSLMDTISEVFEGDTKMLEIEKKIVETLPEYHLKELKNPKWDLVLTHGDCWCNNLMFQYEATDTTRKISKVCILDWQLAIKGSPALDLTYFFLSHSPKEVLYDYKNYLKLYHDTVSENLRGFSCDPEEVFPYSLLEQHWKKFVNFGLCTAMMLLKMMKSDSDEAPDINEHIDSGKDLLSYFTSNLNKGGDYYQQVRDLLTFAVDTELV